MSCFFNLCLFSTGSIGFFNSGEGQVHTGQPLWAQEKE